MAGRMADSHVEKWGADFSLAGIDPKAVTLGNSAGFKTFFCPTPSLPPLQVHLFSLHTHTPLLSLHPDTRREGLSIRNPTSKPLTSPTGSFLPS